MRQWSVSIALVVLSLVPTLGGVVRLHSLTTPITEQNARFVAAPLPVVLHVIAAVIFSVLGAFQFAAAFRRRSPRWHRLAGRVVAMSGLVAGVSGVWMTARYDIPTPMQGPLLLATRLVVGSAMTLFIVLGVRAILQRDVPSHEAWMTRAYALGQGAGTQVLLLGVPALFLGGDILGPTRDVLMLASWVSNAVLAEWLIRRHQARTSSVAAVSTGSLARRAS